MQSRERIVYLSLAAGTILAGLSARRLANALPEFIGNYAPDALWSALVYWLIRLFAPRWSVPWMCVATLLLSFAVELSQLYHAGWIDRIRATTLGGLILGFGFLWSDLICYALGTLGAAIVDFLIRRGFHPSRL